MAPPNPKQTTDTGKDNATSTPKKTDPGHTASQPEGERPTVEKELKRQHEDK